MKTTPWMSSPLTDTIQPAQTSRSRRTSTSWRRTGLTRRTAGGTGVARPTGRAMRDDERAARRRPCDTPTSPRGEAAEERSDADRAVVRRRVPREGVAGPARRCGVAHERERARRERRDAEPGEPVDRRQRELAFDRAAAAATSRTLTTIPPSRSGRRPQTSEARPSGIDPTAATAMWAPMMNPTPVGRGAVGGGIERKDRPAHLGARRSGRT